MPARSRASARRRVLASGVASTSGRSHPTSGESLTPDPLSPWGGAGGAGPGRGGRGGRPPPPPARRGARAQKAAPPPLAPQGGPAELGPAAGLAQADRAEERLEPAVARQPVEPR